MNNMPRVMGESLRVIGMIGFTKATKRRLRTILHYIMIIPLWLVDAPCSPHCSEGDSNGGY